MTGEEKKGPGDVNGALRLAAYLPLGTQQGVTLCASGPFLPWAATYSTV